MPISNSEGITFLREYLANIDNEFRSDPDEAYEARFILKHMISALELNRTANDEEIASFVIGRTLASVLLGEIVEEYPDELSGWKKFDVPFNAVQMFARVLVSAIGTFDNQIRNNQSLAAAYRRRQQIADSFINRMQK